MLLDRIDIDNHGPLTRVELGPFSEFLNVICTPEGSGKTAIARFIRDSLIRRDYPLGMMSSSAGRVVWAKFTADVSMTVPPADAEPSNLNRAAIQPTDSIGCMAAGLTALPIRPMHRVPWNRYESPRPLSTESSPIPP